MEDEDFEIDPEMEDRIYDAFRSANQVKFGSMMGKEYLLAAAEGNLARLREIAAMPVDQGGLLLLRFLSTDEQGNSALHLAAMNGHEKVVEYLLAQGLTGEGRTNGNKTPRDLAEANGHTNIVRLFDALKRDK